MDVSVPNNTYIGSQSEANSQISHVGISDRVLAFHHNPDTPSLDFLVRYHELRDKHIDEYSAIWRGINDTYTRQILNTVTTQRSNNEPCKYQDLFDTTSCSERTVYDRVKNLKESNVLTVVGKPAMIDFPSEDVYVLCSDILRAYFDVY